MSDIIKSLGLKVYEATVNHSVGYELCAVVKVNELRAAFDKLPVVYCSKPDKENSHLWNHYETKGYDTHKARLLGVEKIVKEPLRMEFKTHLEAALYPGAEMSKIINAFAGKRVKVVVTEIQEGE